MTNALASALRVLLLGALVFSAARTMAGELSSKTGDGPAEVCEEALDATYSDLDAAYEEVAYLTGDRLLQSTTTAAAHESCASELDQATGELAQVHDDVHTAAEHDARDDASIESDRYCVRWCSVAGCGVCVQWSGRDNDVVTEEISFVIEAM